MSAEMPSISSSAYSSSAVNPLNAFGVVGVGHSGVDDAHWIKEALHRRPERYLALDEESAKLIYNELETKMPDITKRRLVQVFIADPDENIPLEQSLLYTGTQKLTDATDQELFFEIDIKAILEKHNKARIGLVNKNVKERTEYLEPARVRDLRMVVTTIATF